jgi:hypothetical protein
MQTQEPPTPTPRKSRLPLIIGGVVVLVLLLAGAAFVGGRLLNGQGLSRLTSGLQVSTGPGGGTQVRVHAGDVIPAKELPQTPPDVNGIFDHRQDQSIFVGTGTVQVLVQKDASGKVQASSSHSGPVVEVVVTTQTIIYKDVTMQQFNGKPPVSGQKIQQVVEPGSLDEIGQPGSSPIITVWGRKTGDRYIADVIVYGGGIGG